MNGWIKNTEVLPISDHSRWLTTFFSYFKLSWSCFLPMTVMPQSGFQPPRHVNWNIALRCQSSCPPDLFASSISPPPSLRRTFKPCGGLPLCVPTLFTLPIFSPQCVPAESPVCRACPALHGCGHVCNRLYLRGFFFSLGAAKFPNKTSRSAVITSSDLGWYLTDTAALQAAAVIWSLASKTAESRGFLLLKACVKWQKGTNVTQFQTRAAGHI